MVRNKMRGPWNMYIDMYDGCMCVCVSVYEYEYVYVYVYVYVCIEGRE